MSKFSNPEGTPYYCVVGQPIDHSLSPLIHQTFAAAEGITLCYERVEVGPGELASALSQFEAVGGRGMNVTVPLKEEAAKLATELKPRAQQAGAGNTISIQAPGHYLVDNTDGVGLVTDLVRNLNVQVQDRRILILGAGGAVRGALLPLIEQVPTLICIANRTLSKAQNLVQQFHSTARQHRVDLQALDFANVANNSFDIIINGTSMGLQGKVPDISVHIYDGASCCYDMMYDRTGVTAFTEWSRTHGAERVSDGLGMLVEQAAEAFLLWHGVRPRTARVIESIRATT